MRQTHHRGIGVAASTLAKGSLAALTDSTAAPKASNATTTTISTLAFQLKKGTVQ